MRWVFALLRSTAPAALVLSLAAAAQAQSASDVAHESVAPQPEFLSVSREPGAESCPDTAALSAHIQRLRGDQPTREPSTYRVSFSYRGGVFRADIRVGHSSGVRVLRDRRATCASLEQATALTLALLLDSDAHDLPIEPQPEPEPPVEPPRPPPSPPAPRAPRENAANITLSLGGAGMLGVVQPIAPVVLGDLGIGVNRFRTSIGVVWMPTQTVDFGPGQLHETLLSGVARTCLSALRNSQARLDLCSGIYAGLLKVRAVNYTRNDSVDKAWLAVPLELLVSTTSSPLGVQVGASALFQVRRNDFSIDKLGVAYSSWPIGMLLSMRAVGSWLL